MRKITLRERFAKLPHPDYVGAAEYRLIHDYVADLIEEAEGEEEVLASLFELRATADAIYSDLVKED